MATTVGGTVVWNLDINTGKLSEGLAKASKDVSKFAKDTDKQFAGVQKAVSDQLGKATQASQLFAKSLIGVTAGLAGIVTKSTLTAARTETLGIAMAAVAKATGTSTEVLQQQEAALKKQGITTQEARNTLTRFMQSQLDVAQAAKIARVAQDLAVISGENSSQTTARLTDAIATMNPMLLRQVGIVKTTTEIFDTYGATLGKSGDSLSELEKKQALVNVILTEGEKVTGAYEASMETAGKKMGSLARHFEEAANSIGVVFLPALGFLVDGLTELLKMVTQENVTKFLSTIIEYLPIIAGAIIGALVPAILAAIPAVIALGASLLALLPFIVVGALIGAAIVALIKIIQNWGAITDWIRDKFTQASSAIGSVFSAMLSNTSKVFNGIKQSITNTFNSIVTFLNNIASSIVSAITKPFRDARASIDNIAGQIKSAAERINPFHRESPSLVDNVIAGIDQIKKEYASLSAIALPPITSQSAMLAPESGFSDTDSGLSSVSEVGGGNQYITLETVNVNDRADIDQLVRELGFMAMVTPGVAV